MQDSYEAQRFTQRFANTHRDGYVSWREILIATSYGHTLPLEYRKKLFGYKVNQKTCDPTFI